MNRRPDVDGEQDLRHAVSYVRTADRLLSRAVGGLLLERGWRLGQEIDADVREVRDLSDDLHRLRQRVDWLLEHRARQ